MKKFKNVLLNLKGIDEECLQFLVSRLETSYSLGLLRDLMVLPIMQHKVQERLSLLLALIEEGEVNDYIVTSLCEILENISGELWDANKSHLIRVLEEKFYCFSREESLRLAHSIEVMVAKRYAGSFGIAHMVYQRISQENERYSPDSEDSVRIALAKIAYSTNCHNWVDKLTFINQIKVMANSSERQYLKGVIFYYKGLCLDKVSESVDYKDGAYFMCKSREYCFPLANTYLNYSKKLRNFEDDSENRWD